MRLISRGDDLVALAGSHYCRDRGMEASALMELQNGIALEDARTGRPSGRVQGTFLVDCRSCFAAMARIRNVFEIIELYGHDENFEPQTTDDFIPTQAPAGSREKLDILAERIQRGLPLWHPEDSTDTPTDESVLVGT